MNTLIFLIFLHFLIGCSANSSVYVSNVGAVISLFCNSQLTPVWMKDDKVAQSLAVGGRKVARFTDQRYHRVLFKIRCSEICSIFVSLNG